MNIGLLASLVSVSILLGSCHQPAAMPPATACTPPRADWQAPHFIGGLDAPYSQVSIDHASNVYLDGRRVTLAGLKSALGQSRLVGPPRYDVFLEAEMGARCQMVDAVRDHMAEALNCPQSGRCAEGSRAVWFRWPVPPGTPPS
jgi:hypothetical protein